MIQKLNFKNLKFCFVFLKLNHQKLDVYQASQTFVLECYRLTKHLPADERFGMISQIRRAALSCHLNIAEGASRKSETERKRYYEVARGSIVEVDAALDIAEKLGYLKELILHELGKATVKCFQIVCRLINPRSKPDS